MAQDYENSDTRPYIEVEVVSAPAKFVKADSPRGIQLILEQNEKLRELFATLRERNRLKLEALRRAGKLDG